MQSQDSPSSSFLCRPAMISCYSICSRTPITPKEYIEADREIDHDPHCSGMDTKDSQSVSKALVVQLPS